LIETEGLTKRFGTLTAVENLSLQVDEGEAFGFLGPNGAGKTTTVRMLTSLISKTSGKAWVGGLEVGLPENALKVRRMVGLLPENVGLYDELSALENLEFYGRLYECPKDARRESIERLLRMLGLWEERNLPVGSFSKGMKQKVAIARALVHEPRILFLDEPTANLDPESAKTVRDFILQLKKEHRTIFLTTHNLDEAQRVCDRVGILRTKLLKIGSPAELKAALWGTKTAVQLERADPSVVAAVRERLRPRTVELVGRTLVVDVADGEKENPEIVEAVVRAGGRVQKVTELSPSLEDVYLGLMRG
jgi:ABC-2 type transport system ATP-binding protein